VARLEACLVDVYETTVTADYTASRTVLPELAGVPADAWWEEFARIRAALTVGQLSIAEGVEHVMRALGVDPRQQLVDEVVDKRRDLLLASARLYDDAIPFLSWLRSRGIAIAIVSNSTEPTRELLTRLGVAALADSLVLSYEVGYAKPEAEIYWYALGQVGVAAGAAVFVDDQAAFCAAGAAIGMSAVQIVRGEMDGKAAAGTAVVRSLLEVESMF
jgi:HAD superfamily hydrolase (TIGR01509 family)